MSTSLPAAFASLEPFAAEWAMATQNGRQAKRLASSAADLRKFYDAMLPHIEAVLDLADTFPVGQMSAQVEQLFFMALMLAEISPNVELYGGQPGVPHSFEEPRMIAVHGELRG
jgi:hypothetical protein